MSYEVRAATILERSVCLTLRMRILDNNRKVKTKKVVEATGGYLDDSNQEPIKSTWTLVDSKILRPCCRIQENAKAALRKLAIPSHRVFGDGTFLVPIAAVTRADALLKTASADLREEAIALSGRWAGAVAEQTRTYKTLGLLQVVDFDRYPTADEARSAWGIEWNYVSFAAPERLETVDRALFEIAEQKYEERMTEAFHEIRLVLRETLQQYARELARKLTPDEDGKPKTIRSTVLRDLRDFFDTYSIRNITDDDELTQVVTRLKQLTRGIDREELADSDQMREHTLSGATAALAQLDKLVTKGRRAITFGPVAEAV